MNEFFRQAFDLSGQVALVTGGGSGLGFATAKCLACAGARVVITGRREDVLKKACQELGEGVSFHVFDVTDTDHAGKLIETIVKEHGSIDILVNNAGRHCKKAVEDITIQDFRDVMDVHLYGSFALSQSAIPYMKEKKRGSIIFISSMSALLGMTKVCVYGSAKSAMMGLTRCLAGDVSADGIRVNAIIPGFIDTPMFHQAVDSDIPRQNKILGHTPMNCYGKPEDIGWAAVYLSSKAAGFVNGTAITVDGGCAIGF